MNRDQHGTITTGKDIFPGQYRWDPLDYLGDSTTPEQAAKLALSARTRVMNMIRKERGDLGSKGWTLTGQVRKYASFGVEDGRVRNVYYLNVFMKGQN